MAVNTGTITSFAAVGVPMTTNDFNVFESTTSPKRSLGFKVETVSGDVYRWSHFGAAVTQGKIVSQDLSGTSVVDSDDVIVVPASAVTVTDGTLGSRYIEITLASKTKNQFAGGKITITDDTGEGYTYNIIGNTATGNPAANNIRVELASPLQVAVTASSDFAITGSLYNDLIVATSTDYCVAGVSMASQAADDYGWIMTRGTVGILGDGNGGTADLPQIGKGIICGSVDGSVQVATATNDNVFGYCIVAPDDTGYGIFKINCE
jgi:hypothetical protein